MNAPDARDEHAVRTADGSATRYSPRYGETFHSVHGARREAVTVYLEAAGIAARLDAGRPARVLEIGFGLGLNARVTAERAIARGAALDYHAIEHDLVDSKTLGELYREDRRRGDAVLGTVLTALTGHERRLSRSAGADGSRLTGTAATTANDDPARSRSSPTTGTTPAAVTPRVGGGRVPEIRADHGSLALSLHLIDASAARFEPDAFDAVYLDAFSPAVNPECWSPPFLAALHGTLRPGGALVSYCVRGTVRRALERIGFAVERRPGPPGKRQTLVATRRPAG